MALIETSPPASLWSRLVGRLERFGRRFRPRFDWIAADVTDRCNLRCTFCGTDHSGRSGTVMDRTTFQRLCGLMPLVADGACLLSCRFEPLLHPCLMDLIESIPACSRRKVAFTTSLAMPLDDETIGRLGASGIHHVNVSVESLRADVYEAIRRGGRFAGFLDNLGRLAARFAVPGAPRLRFITVVLQENVDELVSIVETCATRYGGSHHELRHVYEPLGAARRGRRLRGHARPGRYRLRPVHDR
ncbi:MAG: radical SAM protein [Candidatus Riflebacteria bacterium]|nr:radical SAM protein [Candidatus Riflebacteria bacterium]